MLSICCQHSFPVGPPQPSATIRVRGARVHNMQNVDLDIPRDALVVLIGVSGSGKSSLAFDTLFAEGQRRYLESLSARARQYLDQLERSKGLAGEEITAAREALASAEKASDTERRDGLTKLASRLESAASSAGDAAKVRTLTETVQGLAAAAGTAHAAGS